MKRKRILVAIAALVFGVLTLSIISNPMKAQNAAAISGFPPQFAPDRTFRTPPPPRQLIPSTKFVKINNPLPNKYIVILNDDVVANNAPVSVRRAQIAGIANELAHTHNGKRGFVYETALKGFSIELPNETAAVALSKNPRVMWVEEEGTVESVQTQTTPPWGLDRIDQLDPVGSVDFLFRSLNGTYSWADDGRNIVAYVIDHGVLTSHHEFTGRLYQSIDCTNSDDGNADDCVTDTTTPNSVHGTHVAGILGGTLSGVAKGVTIRSVKVDIPVSTVIAGVNWVTRDFLSNPAVKAVANMSLSGELSELGTSLDDAVSSSINDGVTFVVSAGNNNHDATNNSPADV